MLHILLWLACTMYHATSMNHTRLNFNGYYLLLGIKTLDIPCIYNAAEGQCDLLFFMLCIICEMAFCGDHSPSHDCIGTHRSHENPKKYEEFHCQHCLIKFKEYSGTERYADFTHTFFIFWKQKKNKRKKLKGEGSGFPRLSYFHQKSIYLFTC